MTTTDVLRAEYLRAFEARASEAGLTMSGAGKNWVRMLQFGVVFHVSMSVSQEQTQVNLNNEADGDRAVIQKLTKARSFFESATGAKLEFENKPNVKKSAVRATLGLGFVDRDTWGLQHDWAISQMRLFDRVFQRWLSEDGEFEKNHPAYGLF